MTRVDFYILPDADEDRRRVYVCRLVDKAWRTGHRVWIHAPAEDSATALDERLWTFSQGSFVPHELDAAGDASSPEIAAAPVVLGGGEPDADRHLLVNENTEVPSFFSRFERVAEIIGQNETAMRSGRERYAFYRDRGYELHYHRVS